MKVTIRTKTLWLIIGIKLAIIWVINYVFLLLLQESYAVWFWVAFVVCGSGIFLAIHKYFAQMMK